MVPILRPAGAARPQNHTGADKYAYIDAVRGWAILLVMTHHVGGSFSEMPYPIKKLINFGWHGVQMFFLASAVTLMMSWQRQSQPIGTASWKFFVRRFLRIAPMYYAGALLYYLAVPPETGFDLAQMLRSFLFVNAWNPSWIPTIPGWMVVPGGWSIGVEFTFYALFPILASILTTFPRSILFLLLSVVVAVAANKIGVDAFAGYGHVPVDNFLYFWFPNQAPIFALGILLYHCLTRIKLRIESRAVTYGAIAAVIAFCVTTAEVPLGTGYFSSFTALPTLFIAAMSFMVFIFMLAKGAPTFFVHPFIRRLGVLSFSCYVLHFLFVYEVPYWSHGLINIKATGYGAIGTMVLLWVATMASTIAAAELTHRLIEQPGMDLARRLTSSRRAANLPSDLAVARADN